MTVAPRTTLKDVFAACRTDDPVEAYDALARWLDETISGPEAPSLAVWAKSSGDPDLIREVSILSRAVAEPEHRWSAVGLTQALAKVSETESRPEVAGEALPPLNPLE